MTLWFKHCYTSDVDQWSCLGLPRNQLARNVFDAKFGYEDGDDVVLALTRHAEDSDAGHIFAVCTLLTYPDATRELVPADVDANTVRWPTAIALDKLWRTAKKDYRDFVGGALGRAAEEHRGKLFPITGELGALDVAKWLEDARGPEQQVRRVDKVRDFVERRRRS